MHSLDYYFLFCSHNIPITFRRVNVQRRTEMFGVVVYHTTYYFCCMNTALRKSFLEARAALPPAVAFDDKIIIISVGESIGEWSRYHVNACNETMHFVFTKDSTGNHWICADTGLQRWLDWQHALALQLLEDVW